MILSALVFFGFLFFWKGFAMPYENSAQCKMLATHCCCCGRPLVDAISVELGIGPDCRAGVTGGIEPETQREANILTHRAAIAAQSGRISEVLDIAAQIRQLGLPVLAQKVATRFKNAEKNAKITIQARDGLLVVKTPYRRGMAAEFVEAWRNVPGRRWSGQDGANVVPTASKRQLWDLLTRFFPGQYGMGEKGLFRIPNPDADAEVE